MLQTSEEAIFEDSDNEEIEANNESTNDNISPPASGNLTKNDNQASVDFEQENSE